MIDSMNKLNELTQYIENNLDDEISDDKMARILCVNNYTLQRIFKFITGVTLAEYIRNRRLSVAGIELVSTNARVIDLAVKYGYSSADGFSRAFAKFHGVTPQKARTKKIYLKNYPPYSFTDVKLNRELNYRIEHHSSFTLYGIGFETVLNNIQKKAPLFWKKLLNNADYKNVLLGNTSYGVIDYDELFPAPISAKYYVASKAQIKDSTSISIPECDWAIFEIDEYPDGYIHNFSHYVYANWVPYSGYNIKKAPEIEVYNDNFTEWCLPIERN